jgi:hypothetical protein
VWTFFGSCPQSKLPSNWCVFPFYRNFKLIITVGSEPTMGCVEILNQTTSANRINSSYGADHFDSTPGRFDNLNIAEYLNGSGHAGGPLVKTNNTDFRSDFRIFNSDGNTTITAMNTPQTFEDTCFDIFERMINTVPKEVKLSTNAVGPRPWITIETQLDPSPNGEVLYSGTIATHSHNGSPDQASYYYGTAGGGKTNPRLTNVGCV